MALHRGELLVTDWLTVDDAALAELLGAAAGPTRPALVLVDGGSGTGKTTAATWIAQVLDAPVVHTDDLAWHLDPIAWDDVLIEHVITPWRAGRRVRYRPDAWVNRARDGAIEVPAAAPWLVVEGVGAARASLAELAHVVVWVQADRAVARERGLARDVSLGRTRSEAQEFWDAWDAHELPFLEQERPWERADLIVDGIPDPQAPGAMRVHVASGGLRWGARE